MRVAGNANCWFRKLEKPLCWTCEINGEVGPKVDWIRKRDASAEVGLPPGDAVGVGVGVTLGLGVAVAVAVGVGVALGCGVGVGVGLGRGVGVGVGVGVGEADPLAAV